MDADEVWVLLGSLLLAVWAGAAWYLRLRRQTLPPRRASRTVLALLGVLPIALLVGLAVTLRLGAAREVREDGAYLALFGALGAVWLVGIVWATAWLGIHIRDDALERSNLAASSAVAGALVGGMTVYAFANLGEGDTIYTTIGPALLATAACLAVWAAHQALSGATDSISIDRDLASGIRFAGMAIGTGLILGRSVAGDYQSASGTFRDLWRQGWPALPLAALAAVVQLKLRPTRQRALREPVLNGLLPAAAYVSVGVVDLVYWGSWASAGARP